MITYYENCPKFDDIRTVVFRPPRHSQFSDLSARSKTPVSVSLHKKLQGKQVASHLSTTQGERQTKYVSKAEDETADNAT